MVSNPTLTHEASRGRDDAVITGLVTRARNGERQAGGRRRRRRRPERLAQARGSAGQPARPGCASRLAGHHRPARMRPHPAYRPQTPRRRSCAGRRVILDNHAQAGEPDLLAAERHAALREAFGQLPPGCQHLLALLIEDPALSYAEISARLGVPAGSIGPSRRRCLDKLRRHPAFTALINADT